MATHEEVAIRWADKGRAIKGHNVFMSPDRQTIYSYGYHYPIARWATDKAGRDVVLFNACKSSVSTECQKTIVRRAISPTVDVYHVANPMASSDGDHLGNVKYMMRDVADMVERFPRLRVRLYDRYVSILEALCDVRAYAEAFGVDYNVPFTPKTMHNGQAVFDKGLYLIEQRRKEREAANG